MRPIVILGLVTAAVAAISLAAPAGADSSPPAPQITVTGGSITIAAQGSTHVNPGFPWWYKDGTGNKVKKVADFAFSGGASGAPVVAKVSGVPAGGTLRGGYCQDSGCYTFVASCTASACTITGT
jgi:hypothetical protein